MSGGKKQNSFWRARKRRGLKQKQIASLLGYKTVDQVSRYESGAQTPTLKTALKLEIVLGAPPRVLFSELHQDAFQEIAARLNANSALRAYVPELHEIDFCSFAELLRSPRLTEENVDRVRKHAIHITKAFSDWLQQAAKLPNDQAQNDQ